MAGGGNYDGDGVGVDCALGDAWSRGGAAPRNYPFPTNRSFQGADILHFRTFGGQKKRPGVATRPQFPACGLNHLVAIMIRLERAFATNADISGLLWR